MRRSIALIVALLALPLWVSAREKRFGYCQTQLAGVRVKTCTVEVFITGTLSHPAQIYQDNIGTPLGNPFTASSSTGLWFFYADNARYDVKFSGGTPTISPPYTLSDYLFLDIGSDLTFTAVALQSASANIAQAGFIRMTQSDSIRWRNSTNTDDLRLYLQPLAGNQPADLLTFGSAAGGTGAIAAGAFIQDGTATTVAATGTLRMHIGDFIGWRNAANTNDLVLAAAAAQGNLPESIYVQSQASPGAEGFLAGAFIQNGAVATIAAAGALRLHSSDTICWRNFANSANSCIGKNSSDALTFTNLTFSTITSSSANPAATGFIRLANPDAIYARNASNTLDLPLLRLDSSDDLILAGGASSYVWLQTDLVTLGSSASSVTFQLAQSHIFGEGFIFRANDGSISGQRGGNLALTAGSGITSGAGGSILLTPGASGSGSRGVVQISALDVFARLPACAAGTEGGLLPVSDSSTATWGATITGGGANHVLAYCAGSTWTVAAK